MADRRRGFTIVELLIVIIVIGILAALVLIAYSNVTNQAKTAAAQNDLENIAKQLNYYKENTGGGTTYPADASSLSYSSGSTIGYSVNNTSQPTAFCVTITNGGQSYYVNSSTLKTPTLGTCPDQGLAAWYQMNGNVNDSSSNALTATNNGATLTTGQNGSANTAYLFNGTSNYLLLPSASALNLTDNFTISAWINLSANIGTSIWNHIAAGGGNDWGFGINVDNSGNGYLQLTKVSYADYAKSPTLITKQVWHHVAVTFSSNTVKYYIDGNLDGTTNTAMPAFVPSQKRIGNGGSYSAFFHGTIDDVRIIPRVLSATDITALYNGGAS